MAIDSVDIRLRDAEGAHHAGLQIVDFGRPAHDARAIEIDTVMLNTAQQLERSCRRELRACLAQTHAHDPMEHQRQKTDPRMSPNTLGEPVEYGADLDLALQNPEAALDVGQALVTVNDLGGRQIGNIGEQHKLAVQRLMALEHRLVDILGEQIAFEVDFDDRTDVGPLTAHFVLGGAGNRSGVDCFHAEIVSYILRVFVCPVNKGAQAMNRIVRPLFWSAFVFVTGLSLLPSVHLLHNHVWLGSTLNILVFFLLGLGGFLAYPMASARVVVFLLFYGLGVQLVQGGAGWGLGSWLDFLAKAIGVGFAFLGWSHFINPEKNSNIKEN